LELLEPFGMLTVPDPVGPPGDVVKNVVPVEVVATTTVADEPVLTTGLPKASSAWTTKAVAPATGAAACELGADVNTKWVVVPGFTVNVTEVAEVNPLELAWSW
jgi:hypothetical protein